VHDRQRLLTAAIHERLGHTVGSDQLIRLALDALMAGIDAFPPPEVAGRLISIEGWNELGHPSALRSLVGWLSEWEDWNSHHTVPRETYQEYIVAEAEQLLDGPWPPVDSP
jgi:hypothetical protein